MIDIIIPSLRPDSPQLVRCLKSIETNTTTPYKIHITDEGGFDTSYAQKINLIYPKLTGEFMFLGADDLIFYPNWDIEALKVMDKGFDVVGSNDLHNQSVTSGLYSTHYMIRRKYLETVGGTIDNSFPVLYEYGHNYCDTEFIDTARKRGVWSPCLECIVEHFHWTTGLAPMDKVYEIGLNTSGQDKLTFESRKHLWQ